MSQFDEWTDDRWADALDGLAQMGLEVSAVWRSGEWQVTVEKAGLKKQASGRTVREALAQLAGRAIMQE